MSALDKIIEAKNPSKNDAPVVVKDNPVVVAEVKEDKYTPPAGSYQALNLRRIAKANGEWFLPNIYGFYVPTDDDERSLLKHFAAQNLGYVKAV